MIQLLEFDLDLNDDYYDGMSPEEQLAQWGLEGADR